MKKRFKAKKRRRFKFHLLWYLFLIIIMFTILYLLSNHFKLATTNEEFIKYLLQDPNYYLKYENKASTFLTNISSFFNQFEINEPISILEHSLNYTFSNQIKLTENKKEEIKMSYMKNDVEDLQIPKKARVYIYNTHSKEGYASSNLESYNITPNVVMASHLLKEKLNNLGISTIVEESDINEFMAIHNLTHAYSYEASRYFLKDAIKNNPDLDLIIDLHRDALSKKNSTVVIEGTSYAKILFVSGKENPNYKKNLELMTKINNKIKAKYPTLTRGILIKEGAGVDGVYNQDVSPNIILLECGGNENNIGEVTNTLTLIAPILAEVLNET